MLNRKLLTSAVTGVAVLGLASVAFANGGSFAPVPGPMPAAQPQSAFYIGGQAGWADTHWDNIFNKETIPGIITKDEDTGFAGRVFVGYDYNKYLGLEGGWTYLPEARIDFSGLVPAVTPIPIPASKITGKIKNYAFDLVGVVTAPLGDGLSVHAKAGGDYLYSKARNGLVLPLNGKIKHDHFGVTYGVGASYMVFNNLYATVDWMRFSGENRIAPGTEYQPNPDVVLGGLTYKFPIDLSY